jgi:signal transduction histidine kinase/predicted ATPase
MVSHELPSQATQFIGRDAEVEKILGLLNDPACRLLTLMGQGGIGKTRLSLEAAQKIFEQHDDIFPQGVIFVPLAPIASAKNIPLAIADALSIHLNDTNTLDIQLINHLKDHQLVLVLDNFEHVMDGAKFVSDLLAGTDHVKILVTSRERLHLTSEQVFILQGMMIPDSDQIEQIEDFDSLVLFQRIAEKMDQRFSITDALKPCVIRICQLVEGMPLAIELAAAWVRALSCETILQELEHSFEILGDTLAHVPKRHRNLRMVFEYSWNLLTSEEQAIFQRLSVFRGGFGLEAAKHVTGATEISLSSFIDKSLLQHNTSDRYQIHELLRQFAEDKLSENPEHITEAHYLHGIYFSDFLFNHRAGFTIFENRNIPVVITIKTELDNIRSMWDWAIEQQQFDMINRASDSLYHYYRLSEACKEATEVLGKAMTKIETAKPFQNQDRLLAKLLSMIAYHAKFSSLQELAQEVALKGLSLARQLNISDVKARCLVILGDNALDLGQYDEARQYLEESIEIYDELGEIYEDQFPHLLLALAYRHLGKYELASQSYHDIIIVGKQRNSDSIVAWTLSHLGFLNNILGQFTLAKQQNAEAKEIFEDLGITMGILSTNKNLAISYCGMGQYDMARHHFQIALNAYLERGSQLKGLALKILLGIANLMALEGNVVRAVELSTFIRHNFYANSETQMFASGLLDELKSEIQPEVFQLGQERAKWQELEPLVTGFINEFSTPYADDNLDESLSDPELDMLQQMADNLATGRLLDKTLSEQEKESVGTLITTVDELLEREKEKMMATFLQSASHDLRTPLTVINTSLYLLEMISDPDKQKGRVKLIEEQVTHLQTLIEDLISIARLDRGTELELQPLDLNQLLIALRETHIASITQDRDLDVQFALFNVPMMVLGDSENLLQALLNIIKNAINYTPDGGTIRISTEFDATNIRINIQDTGVGIAEDDLPQIFERFFRVDEARTDRGHSGLGLAITKKIIEAHHGWIEVSSTLSEGSHFHVYLPHMT